MLRMSLVFALMAFTVGGCARREDPEMIVADRLVYTSVSGMRFIFIPEETFVMGTGREDQPYRNVRLTGYWIGETEITNEQIEKVATPARAEHNSGDEQPACNRTYHEIIEIIEKLSALDEVKYGLPTDAQWECAARGGLESKEFPWGDEIRGEKSRSQIDRPVTANVRSFPPNRYGLYDVTGNADELVREADYDPEAPQTDEVILDPIGLIDDDSDMRLIRGGFFSLWTAPVWFRAPQPFDDATIWFFVGFRLALEDSKELQAAAVIEKGSRVSD